ncbi:NAD(+) diphosphatase [Glycocaulis alkaliphilus]|nr:NAD(+) diphosphatase [Glycocaulis alkaliphilus]GGB72250.1 NADH pyrophosphatase [Glycocaulis alkaliphilus]
MHLTFTRSPLDHSGVQRTNPAFIEACLSHPAARAILLTGGNVVLSPEGEPEILHPAQTSTLALERPGLVFLGLEGETPWFAASVQPGSTPPGLDFRRATMIAEPDLAAILGRARAILSWHGRRHYCSNCGAENAPAEGGTKLVCPSCGTEHFPRTDPSVIMLPYSGDRCVMGRQPAWPPGLFATLAGFMEPGETIEEACAREVAEETGLKVLSSRYVASQPWPFPSTLMIGLLAEIEPGEPVAADDIEEARWFTRAEVRELYEGPMMRWGPPHYSISRLLIETWLNGG